MHLPHLQSSLPARQKATILLVESNSEEVSLLQKTLAEIDLEISLQVVDNCLEAVYYLAGKEPYADASDYPLPVLVITPLNMRKFSGLDLFNWIKYQPQFKHLPIILKVALEDKNSALIDPIAQLSSFPYFSSSLSCKALAEVIRWVLHQEVVSQLADTIVAS